MYQEARRYGWNAEELVDFSANINPLGLARSVREAIADNLQHVIHYPDAQAIQLKQAIHIYYGVPLEQIVLGNGAVELLYLLCQYVRPRQVLIPAPTFSEYERAARAAGATVDYYLLAEADNFTLYANHIAERLTMDSIIFLGNPNNPTGTLMRREEIEIIVEQAARRNCIVLIDESFIDFLADDTLYTCRSLVRQYRNVIILHSLTKFYAIPGLRLGFALAQPSLCEAINDRKDPWNVNCLAQAAGVAALADKQYQQQSRAYVEQAKMQLFQSLQAIPGLKPYFPAVNYILINLAETGIKSSQLRLRLLEHKLLVRDCSNYPGLSEDYIRVAVKQTTANQNLVHALQKILVVT